MAMPKAAYRFITGPKLNDALSRIRLLNKQNIRGMIDFLGEGLESKQQVKQAVKEYERIADKVKVNKLNAAFDVKLTNLGLCIDKQFCYNNLKEVIAYAKKANEEVWIDAEQYQYWNNTLAIFLKVRKKYPNASITIQARLKHAEATIRKVLKTNTKIRLVKGAYKEDPKVAFNDEQKIRKRFSQCMNYLFKNADTFAIATHDLPIIKDAIKLQKKYQKKVEFQFLMGLGTKVKKELSKKGFSVAEYIPYGTHWQSYYQRRLEYLKTKKSN